jgi:surface antigen
MFNKKGESQMSNLKIDIIKKVMMLDTRQELQNVLDVVGNSISRELDNDDKDQAEFAKWKAERGKNEITF